MCACGGNSGADSGFGGPLLSGTVSGAAYGSSAQMPDSSPNIGAAMKDVSDWSLLWVVLGLGVAALLLHAAIGRKRGGDE